MTAAPTIAHPQWHELPEVRAAFDEMAEQQRQFDATRPPCPKDWCDGTCETEGHFGIAVMHVSKIAEVPAEADRIGDTGSVWVRAQRHDALTEPTTSLIEIDFNDSGSLIEERASFTPAQARQLAAQLLRHADMVEPEYEVPAENVRVGDFLPVGGEWRYVYCVDHDEPSNTVKLLPTIERGEWPEIEAFDEDATAQVFEPGDMVRIRRGCAR